MTAKAEPPPPTGGGGGARPGLVNLANALTVIRLVLVPVVVACLLAGGAGWRVAAFIAFGTASVTDLLDGRIARSRGLITDFGKIADPIADKALTGAALVTMSYLGWLAWWVTVVILAREVAVTGLRFWVIRRGVIAASRGGKLKTLLQVLAISLYMLPGVPEWLREVVMAAAVVVTVATGGDYVVRAIRLRRRPPAGAARRRERRGGPGPGRARPGAGAAGPVGTGGPDRQRAGGAGADAGYRRVAHRRAARRGDHRRPRRVHGVPGGVIAYATELKAVLLGVPQDLLAQHGPIHPGVAAAMAAGARGRLGATWGLATTGVAGPDPADGFLPGTVHIAASAGGRPSSSLALVGDRDRVRRDTVDRALRLLLNCFGKMLPDYSVTSAGSQALRHQRTRLGPLSPSVGEGRYRGNGQTLREGSATWSCFVTCLVTRCGGCACARVVPSARCPLLPGCPWATCPKSSAARRRRLRNFSAICGAGNPAVSGLPRGVGQLRPGRAAKRAGPFRYQGAGPRCARLRRPGRRQGRTGDAAGVHRRRAADPAEGRPSAVPGPVPSSTRCSCHRARRRPSTTRGPAGSATSRTWSRSRPPDQGTGFSWARSPMPAGPRRVADPERKMTCDDVFQRHFFQDRALIGAQGDPYGLERFRRAAVADLFRAFAPHTDQRPVDGPDDVGQ